MSLKEWTEKDKRCTCIMVNKIDDLLLKRRIMRSLEVLVGGRKTETDKRQLQRTVLIRLGSIFTSVYASVQKLKNAFENKFEGDNTPIVIQPPYYSASKDFQDSPNDEEDTRSSHEYLNDLEEEYQERALLAKCHFARDCWSKALVPLYQSHFQLKPLNSSQHKPELRPTKDFEAKYNKVKAKLALLSLSALASKATIVKNKGLIVEAYEWDEE
ncbi:hypothetical protein Tco_0363181 [Tanacetum coccineum]